MRPPALLAAVLVTALAVPGTPALALATPDYPDDPDGHVTVLRGQPSVMDRLDSPAAVRTARDDGLLRETPVAIRGDALVVRFKSVRLRRAMTRVDGTSTTARFFAALNSANASIELFQTNPGPERLPVAVDLRESDVRVIHDGANATFWVGLDTSNLTLTTDGEPAPSRELRDGTRLAVVVEVPGDGNATELVGEVTFEAFELDVTAVDGGTLGNLLFATGNGSLGVHARTYALPGENVTVRVTGTNGSVLASTVVTARGVPNQSATRLDANLSQDALSPGESFSLEAVMRNRTLFERRGVVGTRPTLSNLTATHLANGSTRLAVTVRYPDDGFVRFWDATDHDPVGERSVPGRKQVRVELVTETGGPGLGERASVTAYWDANDDGAFAVGAYEETRDVRWHVPQGSFDDVVTVRAATPTPTPTPSPTPTPTPTLTATVPPAGTTADAPQGQSGFGVTAPLAALAGLVSYLARRR